MLYGTGTASMARAEMKVDAADMRMFVEMDVWRNEEDRIRSKYIRGSTKMAEISQKEQKGRLRWCGHLLRGEENHIGRHAVQMAGQGRRRGRPRKSWSDCVRKDFREKELDEAEAHRRVDGSGSSKTATPYRIGTKLRRRRLHTYQSAVMVEMG
ncbi:uncharacterized protein [Macrobrachium rosenbergii]|uniref:uncharacterized protein n=1 Tax=Macrobrachium rosenbergii TaxID=79674 RepID=UPI0034D6EEDA